MAPLMDDMGIEFLGRICPLETGQWDVDDEVRIHNSMTISSLVPETHPMIYLLQMPCFIEAVRG